MGMRSAAQPLGTLPSPRSATSKSHHPWHQARAVTSTGNDDLVFPVKVTIGIVAAVIGVFLAGFIISLRKKLIRGQQSDSRAGRIARLQGRSDGLGVSSLLPTSLSDPTSRSATNEHIHSTAQEDRDHEASPSLVPQTLRSRIWRGFAHAFAADSFTSITIHQHTVQTETGGTPQSAPLGQHRDRNVVRLRRTDSGASLRTVPEYKSEHGHDELVLHKAVETRVIDVCGSLNASTDVIRRSMEHISGEASTMPSRRFSLANSLRNSIRRTLPYGHRNSIPLSPNATSRVEEICFGVDQGRNVTEEEPAAISEYGLAQPYLPPMTLLPAVEGETPRYEVLFPEQLSSVAQENNLEASRLPDETHRARKRGLSTFFARLTGATTTESSAHRLSSRQISEAQPQRMPWQHWLFYSSVSALSAFTPTSSSSLTGSRSDLSLTPTTSVQHNRGRGRGSLAAMSSPAESWGTAMISLQGRTISNPLSETLIHLPRPLGNQGANWTEPQRRFMTSIESLTRYGMPVSPSPNTDVDLSAATS